MQIPAVDRRSFLRVAAGAGSVWMAPSLMSGTAMAQQAAAPHFFLNIIFPGGMDTRYTFDARPLAMTTAKRFVNYHAEAATPLVGSNGGRCLATSLTRPLRPFLDRISVLNGVVMMPTFDGHENNIGFLLTGNPFSGESMLPHLNEGAAALPLDYVQVGEGKLLTTLTNTGNSVPLTADGAQKFAARLKALPALDGGSPLGRFLGERMQVAGAGPGRFSAGAAAMQVGYGRLPRLATSLRDLDIAKVDGERAIMPSAKLIGGMFKGNICRSAMLVFDTDLSQTQNLDSHGGTDAKEQPRIIGELMDDLAAVLAYLRDTPYDQGRSLLDVTTVTVGSEFARTMVPMFSDYPGFDFSNAGNDHNPLTNTIMLLGKGIRGGLVLGESDCQSVEETLSGAHLVQDPKRVKHMGRPFDFATGRVRRDLPSHYSSADYLTYSSVANTLYHLFGIPVARHRLLERNGPPAPLLTHLLA